MDNISEIKKRVEAVAEIAREICMKQQETMCLKHKDKVLKKNVKGCQARQERVYLQGVVLGR